MEYNMDVVKNVLNGLKKDPNRIIYTEHYLKQIEKRNIPDIFIEDLVENENPLKINHIYNSIFELIFRLEDSKKVHVIIKLFPPNSIILISAIYKNNGANPPDHRVELEEIYDSAFDLVDLNSKNCFRYGQTVEMEHGINIDFDTYGHPVAIEILRASKKFKLQHKQLSSAHLDGEIEITPDSIRIRLKATLTTSNINTRVIENEIPNDYGLVENVFELKIVNIS